MDVMVLPAVNATLNGIATVLLLIGYAMIRRGRRTAHSRLMIAAFVTSILFLISYVTYHTLRAGVATPYTGTGALRLVYFFVLATHVTLAATVPILALITLSRALRERFDRHRRIARWTLPVWLYVSVTGVLVYLMLYQWAPATNVAFR